MIDTIDREQLQHIVPILNTEHFTLQTGRGSTIAEANGRVTMFLSTVSSSLVALAFVGQISRLGTAFYLFGLVLLPSILGLGLLTFERVLQSGIEDAIYLRGINRIRHLYVELAPQLAPYFLLSTHDDSVGTMLELGIAGPRERRFFQPFVSASGMVAMVNSIVAGVVAGLLLGALFSLPLAAPTIVGIVVFVLSVGLHQWYGRARWAAMDQSLGSQFPTTPPSVPS